MDNTDAQNVFITGVSSGLGHGFAQAYLEDGWNVFGTSRHGPEDLMEHANFRFLAADVTEFNTLPHKLSELLSGVSKLRLAILNAGILGRIADMKDATIDEMKKTMDVNLWANKIICDYLLGTGPECEQIVMISSGASVNGSRGWNGYSLSKAALNMLAKLYAAEEHPTHISAVAPGLIDTSMQDYIYEEPDESLFPSVKKLRQARGTADMPQPNDAARRIIPYFDEIRKSPSGTYGDVRNSNPPPATHPHNS